MSSRYLLQGGCVLTLGARTPNLSVGDVLIEEGIVTAVGGSIRARSAETVDATDTIVMPGFVDAHRHSWKTLFRNLDLVGAVRTDDPALDAQDAYAAALVGLTSALQAGITTVTDWVDPPGSDEHAEAVIQAHRDSAVRTVAVVSSRVGWAWGDGIQAIDGTTLAYGAESSEMSSAGEEWTAARQAGLRIHHHVRRAEGQPGRLTALAGSGLLGDDVTLIGCATADGAALTAISSSGASVVSTPAADMTGGWGSPPIQRLIDHGIRPGLGVGDETSAPGDMFAQMRAINSIQHAESFDLKLSGKSGVPNLLTTRDVIKYATIDGARAIGMSDEIGSLEPGKRADLVVLRTDLPNIHPVNDPIGAVVWGMDSSNVDWVFVGGEPVVRGGEVVGGNSQPRDLALAAHERLISTGRRGPD